MAVGLISTLDASRVLSQPTEAPAGPAALRRDNDFAELVARAALPRGTATAVRAQRTVVSGSQAAEAIERAYTEATGVAPSQGTLSILTSQWALETGQGERMYNYNFAGLKGKGPEGYTAVLSTREGYGASERKIQDGFRAYTDLDAGARDYISLLQRKYPEALQAAGAEDPSRFVGELKNRGYFTGNEADYTRAVTRFANRAMAQGFDALGGEGHAPVNLAESYRYFTEPAAHDVGKALAADNSALALNPGQPLTASQTTDMLKDEISRAALRIAARYGA